MSWHIIYIKKIVDLSSTVFIVHKLYKVMTLTALLNTLYLYMWYYV